MAKQFEALHFGLALTANRGVNSRAEEILALWCQEIQSPIAQFLAKANRIPMLKFSTKISIFPYQC
jgi:hypothetical protein